MGGSHQPDDMILPSELLYFNVKDYGAVGNGVTDDRAAVQATINAAHAAGGGVVFFPTGTYPGVVTGGISTFLLRGTDSGNLLFLGEGRASHVTMAGNGASTDRRLFDIKAGCKDIGFKSLKLSSTLTNEHEQQHLIHFECAPSSTDPETGRAFIIDCYFGHTKGDAIRFLGSDTKRVKHVLVKQCVFQMEHTLSSRSALSFQRSADEVTIDACYTRGASSIDFEPTGIGSNVQHRVTRNHFVGNVTLSGNGAGQEHQRSIFSNNTVVGTISGGNVEQLVVAKNIVGALVVGAFGAGAIGFFQRVHDVVIADNICYRSGDTNTVLVVSVDAHSVGENRNVIIDGNIIVNDNNGADGATILLRPVSGATVHGNMASRMIGPTSRLRSMRAWVRAGERCFFRQARTSSVRTARTHTHYCSIMQSILKNQSTVSRFSVRQSIRAAAGTTRPPALATHRGQQPPAPRRHQP